jgi:orotate phosphoribosyltransferase
MSENIIYHSLIKGNFILHSGQKSTYMFDIMKLISNFDFHREFCQFVNDDFLVGIEFGGAILATVNGLDFAIIRKDGTIYGSPIPKRFVLLDDVVTTENSLRTAIKQIHDQTGYYPDEIKCIVDRRSEKMKALHIESMLECNK